jgi:2-dehydropantoate 2-reductase
MRIAVLGAGAVGSYLGGMLSQAHDVTLIARHEHAAAINDNGLRISGSKDHTLWPRAVTTADGLGPMDLTIVTVKAYDVEKACREASDLLAQSRLVLVVQNGLSVLETAPRLTGGKACIGVASFGVTLRGPGEVGYMGEGIVLIGGQDAGEIASALSASGIATEARKDIATEVWKKALVSSAINPLTAILGQKNKVVAEDPCVRNLAVAIYEEGGEAALAAGALQAKDVDAVAMLMTAERTRENTSSMLQDVQRGRRTEVDSINCELARQGAKHGLKMQYNRAMCQLVRAAARHAEEEHSRRS